MEEEVEAYGVIECLNGCLARRDFDKAYSWMLIITGESSVDEEVPIGCP
jgi:hypothetical protein